MDKDVHSLFSLALRPILDKSENKLFLTQKEYEENSGFISCISIHRDRLESKLKLFDAKLKQSETKVSQLETKLLKKE